MNNYSNISSVALTNGISEEGFIKLLNDIKSAIDSGKNALNNNEQLLSEVNNDEWTKKFQEQVANSNNVIDENLKNIEELFSQIFSDWKEYQKEENKGDSNE